MINGKTLAAVAAQVNEERPRKRDFIVDTRRVTMPAFDKMELETEKGPLEFHPNENFHSQLADRLQIPMPYYKRMLDDQPDLLTKNVNAWLNHKPEKRMVRLINPGDTAAKLLPIGRAFLSSKYRPLDNFDLLTNIAPKIAAAGAKVDSCQVTEHSLYIHALFPKIEREVTVGDAVQSGLIISNSEVGRGSLRISPLVYRLRCKNGLIVPDSGMRKYHIGKSTVDVEDKNLELFSDETRVKMDTAFWAQVNDIVDSVLTESAFEAVVDKFRAASGIKLANPQKAVEITAKQFALTNPEQEEIMRNLIEGADLSIWGLANAMTAMANDAKDYDRGVQYEQFGGQIIELPSTHWN